MLFCRLKRSYSIKGLAAVTVLLYSLISDHTSLFIHYSYPKHERRAKCNLQCTSFRNKYLQLKQV